MEGVLFLSPASRLYGEYLPAGHQVVKFHSQSWSLVAGQQETAPGMVVPKLGCKRMRGCTLSSPHVPTTLHHQQSSQKEQEREQTKHSQTRRGRCCLPAIFLQHLLLLKFNTVPATKEECFMVQCTIMVQCIPKLTQ